MTPYYYVDSESDGWYSQDIAPFEEGQDLELGWLKQLREVYAHLDDEAILVTVDVHN